MSAKPSHLFQAAAINSYVFIHLLILYSFFCFLFIYFLSLIQCFTTEQTFDLPVI